MRDNTSSQLIDMGSLRLERAIRRFEQQDHEGGLEDLRTALHHMRWAGADPLSIQYLASIITAAEQGGELALQISDKRGKSR